MIKIRLIKNLIKIILAYSPKNNSANPPLEYSILKPDTSSDSPSEKSKGVRLVSAREEINQIIIKGEKININKKIKLLSQDSFIKLNLDP